jgi:hypothetical protein
MHFACQQDKERRLLPEKLGMMPPSEKLGMMPPSEKQDKYM